MFLQGVNVGVYIGPSNAMVHADECHERLSADRSLHRYERHITFERCMQYGPAFTSVKS